ncbi:hypothetical protein H311_05061, partial [Anncaliia algerae PRA109]
INQDYIQKNKKCPICINEEMKIVNNNKVKYWRCPKCYKKISFLKDTILYDCKKNLTKIIDIIYIALWIHYKPLQLEKLIVAAMTRFINIMKNYLYNHIIF